MNKKDYLSLNPVSAEHFLEVYEIYGTKYSRMDHVKFVEDSLFLQFPFKFFKSSFPQILFGPFWNTLSHICEFIAQLQTTVHIRRTFSRI